MNFQLHHLNSFEELRLKIRQHRRAILEIVALALLLIYLVLVAASQIRIFTREQFNPADLAKQGAGKFYTVGQSKIYYEFYPAFSEPKDSIVFLHGFGSSLKVWNDQIQYFQQENNVLLVDLPGFGLSQEVDVALINSSEAQAKLVMDLATELKLDNPILIGNSYGGGISLLAALDNPDKVKALVLVGSVDLSAKPDLTSLSFINSPIMAQIPAGLFIHESYARQMLRSAYGDEMPISKGIVDAHFYGYSVRNSSANLIKYVLAPRTDRNSELRQLKLPVLIIFGLNDVWIPEEMRANLAKISQSEWAMVPEVGHLPQQQNPIVFNQLVGNWININ